MSTAEPQPESEMLDALVGEDGQLTVSPEALARLRVHQGDHLRLVVTRVEPRRRVPLRNRFAGTPGPVATWEDFEQVARESADDAEVSLRSWGADPAP